MRDLSIVVLLCVMACSSEPKWGGDCDLDRPPKGEPLQKVRSGSCNEGKGSCVPWGVAPANGTCWPACSDYVKGDDETGKCPPGRSRQVTWDEVCYCEPMSPPM